MIFYCNTAGEEVRLDEPPFSVDVTELAGFALGYNANAYVGRYGGVVNNFSAGIIEKTIDVGICADPEGMDRALEKILRVTQYDIDRDVPGRFYIGDQYILCNMVRSAVNTFFDPEIQYVDKTYTLVICYPRWCTEKTVEYLPEERESESAEYLDYPYDYAYDYLYDLSGAVQLVNDHYAASDFIMTVYGPVLNPKVTIAGHVYEVITTLYEGDYMVVDSRLSKVYKVLSDGSRVDLFNQRNKQSDLFEKIPEGNSTVIYNQKFGFDVTLIQERSEPRWSIS